MLISWLGVLEQGLFKQLFGVAFAEEFTLTEESLSSAKGKVS
jgi:hypothetical protein